MQICVLFLARKILSLALIPVKLSLTSQYVEPGDVLNSPTPGPVSTDTASRLKLKEKSLTSSETKHKSQL